jgi:hypothetical protein
MPAMPCLGPPRHNLESFSDAFTAAHVLGHLPGAPEFPDIADVWLRWRGLGNCKNKKGATTLGWTALKLIVMAKLLD